MLAHAHTGDHRGHDHDRGRDHDNRHDHDPGNFGRAFAIATVLNFGIVALQVVYGLLANSVALLADAGHNFGDAFGLLLAWGALSMSRWQPTRHYTYGYGSASILVALFNALLLLLATGAIVYEAIRRFFEPVEVVGTTVMAVAAIAIVANGIAAWLLMRGSQDDLNIRGAFLHMLADAAVSAGVVVAGGIILLTGWTWLDPLMSLLISVVIVWGTWGLLRDSLRMTLSAVPPGIDPSQVQGFLAQQPGVSQVHDLHIWAMSTRENALTCHLVMPAGHPGDAFFMQICHELDHRFGINHPTIQVEIDVATVCPLAPDHVI